MDPRSQRPLYEHDLPNRFRSPGYSSSQHHPPPSPYSASFRTPSPASSRQELTSTPRQFQFSDERIPTARKAPEPYLEKPTSKSKTRFGIWALLLIFLVAAAVILPIFFLVIRPDLNKSSSNAHSSNDTNGGDNPSSSNGTSGDPTTGNITDSNTTVKPNRNDPASLGIPPSAVGTYYDSTKWLDWTDFNVTYTNVTVGGLPIMGLNSTWDNSARPNSNIPPISEPFQYGTKPITGVAVGGWFILEPFITPSLFNYPLSYGVVDEWTLSTYLGKNASYTLETHYDTFYTKSSFQEIAQAGFDHVRISFPYWFVKNVNPTDPYIEQIGWRYLLRAIEYCREFGIRVNLCLHAAPGSQNGFNHSGRQGSIGWLMGPNGAENANITIQFLEQLATFFSQPRYIGLVTMLSILNEPNEQDGKLDPTSVNAWTKSAYAAVRSTGFNGSIVMHDGFLATSSYIDEFPQSDYPGLVMDTHDYLVFNPALLNLTHSSKVEFVCSSYSTQIQASVNPKDGFGGPTIVGEWSIADTDCALYLNNVGAGSMWDGTYAEYGGEEYCPTGTGCDCVTANAAGSDFSTEYKTFLNNFFYGQASGFQQSWGWFYWTWDTENATEWSYRKLLAAGVVGNGPMNGFSCSRSNPSYPGLSETY